MNTMKDARDRVARSEKSGKAAGADLGAAEDELAAATAALNRRGEAGQSPTEEERLKHDAARARVALARAAVAREELVHAEHQRQLALLGPHAKVLAEHDALCDRLAAADEELLRRCEAFGAELATAAAALNKLVAAPPAVPGTLAHWLVSPAAWSAPAFVGAGGSAAALLRRAADVIETRALGASLRGVGSER
jgi:hypothetical protein